MTESEALRVPAAPARVGRPAGALRRDRYRFIFFDAAQTLFEPEPSVGEAYARAAAAHGLQVSGAEVEQAFRAAWVASKGDRGLALAATPAQERDWWRGLMGRVLAGFGPLRDFEGYFDDLYRRYATPELWRAYPETEAVLAECARRGAVMGVVSNWDSRLEAICRGWGWDRYFSFVLYSSRAGAAKPDPAIFRQALALAGAAPEEVLHVGDSRAEDAEGARAAGLDALWVRRAYAPDEQLATADSLAGVLEFC